jgi:hypothetical protein
LKGKEKKMAKKKTTKKAPANKPKKKKPSKKKKMSKTKKSVIGAGAGALLAGPVGAVAGAYLGPRVNPIKNPQTQSLEQMEANFEQMNPFVVENSTLIEEAFPESNGRLYPLITSYEKDDGGFYSQFSVFIDRGDTKDFVVNSPEFEGYADGEEAAEAALSNLADALEKAADKSDVMTFANPSMRDMSEDEFYLQRDILDFEDEISQGYAAVISELQEKKPNQKAIEAVLRCMSAEVGNMMRIAADEDFQQSVDAYRDKQAESIVLDVSLESLSGLKGNIDSMKGSDFASMTTDEFSEKFLS